jgi:hypothetical protein
VVIVCHARRVPVDDDSTIRRRAPILVEGQIRHSDHGGDEE